MLTPIIFWGATGHAKVLREFAARIGYELAALFDNDPAVAPPFPDVPLYRGDEGFVRWRAEHASLEPACLIAIGGARGRERLERQRFLEEQGCHPIVAVHPAAFVADSAAIGRGSQILAHATVCAEVSMGEACIVNTAASVDHETVLGVGVHVAPGATLAGCVSVGDHTMIGAGAVILPRTSIGRDVIVGAGAVVTRDVADGAVVVGNPARVLRANASGT